VSFEVAADAYDRFMGRYSTPLARPFADFARVEAGQCVLDVGCGPGALTAELVGRVGADRVTACDPSSEFVAAARERHPDVQIERAPAEQLPFADGAFDAALAQLVVHFMADPVAGLREMARVTRAGSTVAACVWDHAAGGEGPLVVYWEAAHELDPALADESTLAGAREGHLAELFAAAGLREIEDSALEIDVEHPTFDDWWEPFTLGVGPAGAFAAGLDDATRAELRARCRAKLPDAPFTLRARAWTARGRA
jgi:SAM-dependent methyltransferase